MVVKSTHSGCYFLAGQVTYLLCASVLLIGKGGVLTTFWDGCGVPHRSSFKTETLMLPTAGALAADGSQSPFQEWPSTTGSCIAQEYACP